MVKVPTAFESGLGQVKTRPDQTPFQSFSTDTDVFGGGLAKSLVSGGQALQELSGVGLAINEANDRAAVSSAMAKARGESNKYFLENVYSKRSEELFTGGASPQQVFEQHSQSYENTLKLATPELANSRQRTWFKRAWDKYKITENSKMTTHLAGQFRSYTGEVAAAEKLAAEEGLGDLASSVEADWLNAEKFRRDGHLSIDARQDSGLSDKDAVELHLQWDDYTSSSAVRGWFKDHTNSLEASKELAAGTFESPVAQEYWNQLDAKQRKSLRNDLIGQAQKLLQLENDQREINKDAQQLKVDEDVNKFFVSDDPADRPNRISTYEKLKNHPLVTLAQKKAMRENLYGGPVVIDTEPGLLELEAAIRNNEIKTFEGAFSFRYNERQVGTSQTMRTRILPLIEAAQDERFTDALSGGLAQLGISDTISETNEVLRRRAATFKHRLLQWKQSEEGKSGDAWTAATRIAAEIQREIKVDPAMQTMLKHLDKSYHDLLKAGKTDEASKTLVRRNKMLTILGLKAEDIK